MIDPEKDITYCGVHDAEEFFQALRGQFGFGGAIGGFVGVLAAHALQASRPEEAIEELLRILKNSFRLMKEREDASVQ